MARENINASSPVTCNDPRCPCLLCWHDNGREEGGILLTWFQFWVWNWICIRTSVTHGSRPHSRTIRALACHCLGLNGSTYYIPFQLRRHQCFSIRLLTTLWHIWRPANVWHVDVVKSQQRTAMAFYEYPLQVYFTQLMANKKIAKIQQKSRRCWEIDQSHQTRNSDVYVAINRYSI